MTTRRKILVVVVVLFTGIVALFIYGIKEGNAIRTSTNASPADVTFLHLPQTASNIGFFRDGINYCAEFSVPENQFRELFAGFAFSEISEPTAVTPKKFGDPKINPHHSDVPTVVVTNGLLYHERWRNGGGYTIVYDRSQSRAYYDSAKR